MKVWNSFSLNLVLRIKYTHANFPSVIFIIVLFRRPSSHWWWCRGACNCQFRIFIRNWRPCSFCLKNCLNHRICSFRFLGNRSCWVVTDRIDRTFKSVILWGSSVSFGAGSWWRCGWRRYWRGSNRRCIRCIQAHRCVTWPFSSGLGLSWFSCRHCFRYIAICRWHARCCIWLCWAVSNFNLPAKLFL